MNNNYSDEQLFDLICENDDDAKNILLNRYKTMIDYLLKKYSLSATKIGIEYNDLYQEALVGFSDGLNSYNPLKDAKIQTFISLCIERRLQNVIIKANTLKNKTLLDSLSLDYEYEDTSFKDILSDNSINDPLNNIMNEETYDELIKKIKEELSFNEYEVFTLLLSGLNYLEIASQLDKNPKQVDNTIQRLKNKIKKILNND